MLRPAYSHSFSRVHVNDCCLTYVVCNVDSGGQRRRSANAIVIRELMQMFLFSVATFAVIFGTVLLVIAIYSWL